MESEICEFPCHCETTLIVSPLDGESSCYVQGEKIEGEKSSLTIVAQSERESTTFSPNCVRL